jgi:hypothetical protein
LRQRHSLVTPGLDPGIHRPSQKMDCRVKPGNDEFDNRAFVIASEAKQSKDRVKNWIASSLRSSQ